VCDLDEKVLRHSREVRVKMKERDKEARTELRAVRTELRTQEHTELASGNRDAEFASPG
jgi:hypothetical protein